MPSKEVVTVATTAVDIGVCPQTSLGYVKSVEWNNNTANDCETLLKDTFTPNPSNGVASPVSTEETRKSLIMPAQSAGKQEWEEGEIPVLGTLSATGSVATVDVLVSIDFK